MSSYDAVVLGSGPNGLAAAITLAKAGQKVLLIEAKETLGGGMRTAELTLPGFKHDVCSAIHPFALASPFFKDLPLDQFGLEWIHSPAAIAHPLEHKTVLSYSSLAQTAAALGQDETAYKKLFEPLVNAWDDLTQDILGPLLKLPKHPISLAKFGLRALPSAKLLANTVFKTEEAKALFAGIAAHAILPLTDIATSAAALMLGTLGHRVGWPYPKGGAQSLADALTAYYQSLGGEIQTGWEVNTLKELPPANNTLLNITPQQLLNMTDELPNGYKQTLERFKYGAAAYKIDYALSEAVPWKDKTCQQAATVHLGGSLNEIAESEQRFTKGQAPEKPYVLTAQQSLFDETRAPKGKHTFWAYCHVPHGFQGDASLAIEAQIERFAPGFKECILAKKIMTPQALQSYNPNYIGGDINGGAATLKQLIIRPNLSTNPYKTPLKNTYLCSSSTPPGGGVHGMAGYNAANSILKKDR